MIITLKGFKPVCTLVWAVRLVFLPNDLSHRSHLYGRSPVWKITNSEMKKKTNCILGCSCLCVDSYALSSYATDWNHVRNMYTHRPAKKNIFNLYLSSALHSCNWTYFAFQMNLFMRIQVPRGWKGLSTFIARNTFSSFTQRGMLMEYVIS